MARKVLMTEQTRIIFGTSVDINKYTLESHIPLPQTGGTHQKFMWWEIPQEYIDNLLIRLSTIFQEYIK